MAEHVQTWRKKLRLQELMAITRKELESGKEITQIYEILEDEMRVRWRFVGTTRKQYLDSSVNVKNSIDLNLDSKRFIRA